jgi:D-aspartate ligase
MSPNSASTSRSATRSDSGRACASSVELGGPPSPTGGSRESPLSPSHVDGAGALVLGASYRSLGILRSLGRRGITVWIVLMDDHRIGSVSRYARRSVRWPTSDPQQQITWLVELAEQEGLTGWTVFATSDEGAALIARNHSLLSRHFLLTTPPWSVLHSAYDKRRTHELAERVQVPQPSAFFPLDRDDVRDHACCFPVILKPTVKDRVNPLTFARAWRIDNRAELLRRYDEACALMPPQSLMIQELIPGGGEQQLSYAALCSEGVVLAELTARRRRQYPVDFGRSSSYVETISERDVTLLGRRLLAEMGYSGVVEVEFKRDPRDGSCRLLDINPRAWGWHSLCARAGVDFPYLLWLQAHREQLPATQARPGVRWVRMVTDLCAVAQELRMGRLSLKEYARSLAGPLEFAILAPDDRLPSLLQGVLIVALRCKRGLRRVLPEKGV